MRGFLLSSTVVANLLCGDALASPHHANVWTNAGLDVQLSDHTTLGVNEELRVNVTESGIEELNTMLALGHDVGQNLQLGAHYRFDVEGWQSDLFLDHRFAADLQVVGTVSGTELALRQRVQPELSSGSSDPFRLVLRTRARASWTVADALQPYLQVEPYLAVTDPPWDRLRFDAGVRLPEAGLDLSYRLDQPLSEPGAPSRHIVTLGITGTVDPR